MAKSPEERRAFAKRARLMMLYRITPEEETSVEQHQRENPNFSVLLTKGKGKEGQLYNDHDHETGLYRGRLSYLINKALGTIENTYKERTPEVLQALALYLRYPPALEVGVEKYGLLGRAKKKKKMIYGKANS